MGSAMAKSGYLSGGVKLKCRSALSAEVLKTSGSPRVFLRWCDNKQLCCCRHKNFIDLGALLIA